MSQITLAEQSAPSTPSSATAVFYFKSDGLMYWKDDAGTEYAVSYGGASPSFVNLTVTGNLSVEGNTTIGNASGDSLTINPSAWTLANSVTITGTWANLGTVTTADINGGTIDGAVIGGASAAAGTFTTLTTSSTVTLNGGTANGVLYLNGSKVATSGSALTFDGTTFTSGSTIATGKTGTAGTYLINRSSDGAAVIALSASGNDFVANNGASGNYIFNINSAEQMRLTSTGLGIGTSSPVVKCQVDGVFGISSGGTYTGSLFTNSSALDLQAGSDSSNGLRLGSSISAPITFYSNGATRMQIDTSGNVGIGNTPSGTYKLEVTGNVGVTGTLYVPYGSAAAPSIEFLGASGHGMWFDGSMKWEFGGSGTVMSLNSSTGLAVTGTISSTGIAGIGVATSSTTNLALAAGTTGVSSLRIPHGSAPTSPVDGDMWTTTAGLYIRINGSTVGPLS